jgi:hypothetical protein
LFRASTSMHATFSAHNRAGSIQNNMTLAVSLLFTFVSVPAVTILRLLQAEVRVRHLQVVGAPTPMSKGAMIAIACGSLIALLVILCLIILLIRKTKRHRQQPRQLDALYNQLMDSSMVGPDKTKALEQLDPNIPLNHQTDDLPYDRKYELPRELLRTEVVRMTEKSIMRQ